MFTSQETCGHGSAKPHANDTRHETLPPSTNVSAVKKYRRPIAITALATVVSLSVTGCAKDGTPMTNLQTGLSSGNAGSSTASAISQSTPDTAAVIAKARDLQIAGNPRTAAQMLGQAFAKARNDENLRRAYAIAALDAGNPRLAYKLTSHEHAPANSDPRQLSVRGAALSTLGHHDKAEQAFASALALSPNDPTLLNNLAMALILKGDAKKAETLLRRAADTSQDDRTRHNLALVLGLQGRIDDAKKVALTLPASEPAPQSEPAPVAATPESTLNETVKASLGGPVPAR